MFVKPWCMYTLKDLPSCSWTEYILNSQTESCFCWIRSISKGRSPRWHSGPWCPETSALTHEDNVFCCKNVLLPASFLLRQLCKPLFPPSCVEVEHLPYCLCPRQADHPLQLPWWSPLWPAVLALITFSGPPVEASLCLINSRSVWPALADLAVN